ncbi:MAG: class B sortase [Lachnospiraceae bacterium]
MKKKKIDIKLLLIFLAAIAVFVYAAVQLAIIFMGYYKGEQEYAKLEKFAVSSSAGNSKGELAEEFSVDFNELEKINPEIVAWIHFENLDINYPVVQAKDNEYYLTRTFNKEELKCGSIFMEAENKADLSDDNTFIYGHNMKDKSMFAKLNNYKEEEIYRENPEFLIYTKSAIYRYSIFSCYQAEVNGDSFLYQFVNQEQYADWLKMVTQQSNYDTGIIPDAGKRTVTLMTCTSAGDNYRFLVHGTLTEIIPVK